MAHCIGESLSMSLEEEEQERLERFRRGEPGAFDDLYATYGPRLYLFGLRLCGKPTDAEDLKQDVFIAAYRNLHRFEGRSSLTTYLCRIALYRWGQIRNGARRETVGWDEVEGAATTIETPDMAHQAHTRLELCNALATLSEAQRAAFLLVKADGFTSAEAAKMLDIPVGTVKSQVHEALLRLRARLGDEETMPGKKAPAVVTKEVVTMTENDPETLSSFEEAESLLGVPVLGFIPMISEDQLRLLRNVSNFSPLMESYRSLRTHLRFCKDMPLKTLVIASSVPSEGKSTAAANLAMAIAREKKRVILVDTDLRRPTQHKLFPRDASPGLTDLLTGTHSLDQVLHPSGVDGVSLITAGSPTTEPTELLGSQEMERLLEELKAQSDIVVIDTAPILLVADTCTFAHATDGVLLVIWAGETKRNYVLRTADLLKRCRAEVLGTVLNCMPMPEGYYYGKYYVPSEELATQESSKESQITEEPPAATRPRIRRKRST